MTEDELLARIYEAPDDDAPREVYADWLSERGDPRGELIVLQLCRARGDTDATKSERERELLGKHGDTWLEGLGDILRHRGWTFAWQRGFVDAIHFEGHARDLALRVKLFGVSRPLRALRRLELDADIEQIPEVLGALALPALSMLRLTANGYSGRVDASALAARAPRLAILALHGLDALTGLQHDHLRELRLRGATRVVAPRVPALDTLEIDLRERSVPPVLDAAAFPALRCVRLPAAERIPPDGGLHWLAAQPIAPRLHRAMLSSLTDRDWRRARDIAPSLAHLRQLFVEDVDGHERDFDALRRHIPGLATSSDRTGRASRP